MENLHATKNHMNVLHLFQDKNIHYMEKSLQPTVQQMSWTDSEQDHYKQDGGDRGWGCFKLRMTLELMGY